jgi:hypothetical protein
MTEHEYSHELSCLAHVYLHEGSVDAFIVGYTSSLLTEAQRKRVIDAARKYVERVVAARERQAAAAEPKG